MHTSGTAGTLGNRITYLRRKDMNWIDLLEEYSINTKKTKESMYRLYYPALNSLIKDIGELENVNSNTLNQHFVNLAQSRSPKTVGNHFRAMNSFFDYLYDSKVCQDFFRGFDEFKYVELAKVRIRKQSITEQEIEKLEVFVKSNANPKDRLLVSLILYMGLSKGELQNLRFKDIILNKKVLYTIKKPEDINEDYMKKVIPNIVYDILIQNEFPSNLEEPISGFRVDQVSPFDNYFQKLMLSILNQKYSFKVIRNSFRKMIIEGNQKNLIIVSQILNESPKTTFDFMRDNDLFDEEEFDKLSRDLLNSRFS